MGESMLTKANQDGKLEVVRDTIAMLLGPDGDLVLTELVKFNNRKPTWAGYKSMPEIKTKSPVSSRVLEPAVLQLVEKKIVVPSTSTSFVAEKHFIVNVFNHRDPLPQEGILFRELGIGFKQFLMDVVEEPQREEILSSNDLLRVTHLAEISLAHGEKSLRTTLTSLYFLLSKQDRGQAGFLKNTGAHNAFLIKGVMKRSTGRGTSEKTPVDGIVKVSWGERGWTINAAKAEHGTPQTERIRFFSPNYESIQAVSEVSSNDEENVHHRVAA